jgi:hypothetical protein
MMTQKHGQKFNNYKQSLDQLLFGCETEYLVEATSSDRNVMGAADFKNLCRLLCDRVGFNTGKTSDEFRISKDLKQGFISIKPDFSFNNIEISYPPISEPALIEEIIETHTNALDSCLTELGFKRSLSAINENSEESSYEMLESERFKAFIKFFREKAKKNALPFFCADYPAIIASTQIHLNVLDESFFVRLPVMYELESLIISKFSKSRKFRKNDCGCARLLVYEDTLGPKHVLKTVPTEMAANWDEYENIIKKMKVSYPEQFNFLARDYSLIRPRKELGTVEFRSACSQSKTSEILSLCAYRVLQVAYSRVYADRALDASGKKLRELVLATALGHNISDDERNLQEAARNRALSTIGEVPKKWRAFLKNELFKDKAA